MKIFVWVLAFFLPANIIYGQVSLYTAGNFKGKVLTMGEGSIARLHQSPVGNDKIVSIKIAAGFTAVLYEQPNFKGEKQVFTSSQSVLALSFEGSVSSVVVYKKGNNDWNGAEWIDNKIILYTNCGFSGNKSVIRAGYFRTMPAGFVKNVSSIKIPGGYVVELFSEPNFKGKSVKLPADEFCFPAEWNKKAASLKIKSDEIIWDAKQDNWSAWEHTRSAEENEPDVNALSGNYYEAGNLMVFSDCYFGGKDTSLFISESYPDVSLLSISSLQIPKNLKVIVYTKKNFKGTSRLLAKDMVCLPADLNNKILSLKIELTGLGDFGTIGTGSGGGGASGSGGGYGGGGWKASNTSSSVVRIFDNCNFSGLSRGAGNGDYPTMPSGFASKVSSIRVPAGKKITVYSGTNFKGNSFVFSKDVNCLPSNWNNKILSMKISSE